MRSTPRAASSRSSSGTRAWRGFPTFKQEATYDLDATLVHALPRVRCRLGEFPGASTPKELDEDEIEEMLEAFGSAAVRAFAAGLDGVELHLSHGYLPWQFISPLYNKRTDRWGGSQENRLRFPVEALKRMRAAAGDDRFVGYRINSTSFWPGDLEIDDVRDIVVEIEKRADIDYVDVSAGVHHAFIHTPMEFEAGWERGYARKIREVSSKPVLLVGRITTPDVAEQLLEAGGRRCHLPRAPTLHRPPLGQEGAGGPHRRHPLVRRRQLLLEEREPGRAGAVHLQPHRGPRGGLGRGHAGQGGGTQERARHRRRPGRAGVRPHRVCPRAWT